MEAVGAAFHMVRMDGFKEDRERERWTEKAFIWLNKAFSDKDWYCIRHCGCGQYMPATLLLAQMTAEH